MWGSQFDELYGLQKIAVLWAIYIYIYIRYYSLIRREGLEGGGGGLETVKTSAKVEGNSAK
jgi:hypothetical protein